MSSSILLSNFYEMLLLEQNPLIILIDSLQKMANNGMHLYYLFFS